MVFLSFVLCLQFMKMEHTDANSRQLVTNIFERCNEYCKLFLQHRQINRENIWNTLLEGIEVSPGRVKRAWTKLSPPLFKMHSFTLGTMSYQIAIAQCWFRQFRFEGCSVHATFPHDIARMHDFLLLIKATTWAHLGSCIAGIFRIDFDVHNLSNFESVFNGFISSPTEQLWRTLMRAHNKIIA